MRRLFRRIFIHDAGLKIWSLFLALIVWYAIQSEKEIETYVQVGVELMNRPSDLLVINQIDETVSLRVRGGRSTIKRLQNMKLPPYKIDLNKIHPGRAVFRLFPNDFKMPADVRITRITPQIIAVELQKQISKEVQVQPGFRGELEQGFSMEQIKIVPSKVKVSGAESAVKLLRELRTSEIRLNNKRESFSGTYGVLLPSDPNLWIEGEPNVKVEAIIVEEVISSVMDGVPISVKGDVKVTQIEPKEATIVVQGKAGLINDLLRSEPKAYVDASKLKLVAGQKRNVKLRVRFDAEEECKVLQVVPQYAQLRLMK